MHHHRKHKAHEPFGFAAALLTEVSAVLGAEVPSCSVVQAVTVTVVGVVFLPYKPTT